MDPAGNPEVEGLEAFVGEWSLEADFPNSPPTDMQGRVTFEWLTGEHFLVQRWEVPHPDAPDGIAIIGYDQSRGSLAQYFFDSRGVSRVYEMSFADGVWKLWRTSPDFTPLSFSQRFEGTFSEDGKAIAGRWEISEDGEDWQLDFHLTYRKVG